MRKSAASIVGKENISTYNRGLEGEDFAFFAKLKPAVMFRLGIYNKEKDCVYSSHQDRFNIDEDAMETGSEIFVRFILDNMNGIEF